MHKEQKACNLIKKINEYRDGSLKDYELIKNVCDYFDDFKNETLSESDLKFLKYIASVIGIPQFYDLLKTFNPKLSIEDIDLNTVACLLYEDTLYTSPKTKLHKFQKEIFDDFKIGQINRYFLSASTSFGKTHLVYEIINKMRYNNVLLIFPTIALLSENYEKIISNDLYDFSKYKVHTLSDVREYGDKNIFIFTPERFLSYMEKENLLKSFDFAFIDEIYKIDNEYIIDNIAKENERDVAYRLAAFYALQKNIDILLAGPYIELSQKRNSFYCFLERNNIKLLNYNDYEIVNKVYKTIEGYKSVEIDDNWIVNFEEKSKLARTVQLVCELRQHKENCIIYCASRASVHKYARELIEKLDSNHNYLPYKDFLEHIDNNYGRDWILYKALFLGIGIHHGLIPKYLQKEIIKLFNDGYIDILISTTTITEGVNTSAKNLIVTLAKKGNKSLRKFDAKNIAGRAGRFLQHYTGRVFVSDKAFNSILEDEEEAIKHKNYDIQSEKDDIDLFYTEKDFLSDKDKIKKEDLEQKIKQSELPDYIFECFKVINCEDKIKIFDLLKRLNFDLFALAEIKKCILKTQANSINYDGFQIVLDIILPIVKSKDLRYMIEYKGKDGEWKHSLLTYVVAAYLDKGFSGLVEYNVNNRGMSLDDAINSTSNFVYNLLKYHLVKYLGAFNLIYKYHIAKIEGISEADVLGFDRLLSKFEYNAFSDKGRLASDYGSTHNIIEYYEHIDDNPNESAKIRKRFDSFEEKLFNNLEKVLH